MPQGNTMVCPIFHNIFSTGTVPDMSQIPQYRRVDWMTYHLIPYLIFLTTYLLLNLTHYYIVSHGQCVHVQLLSCVQHFVTPGTVALQTPLSMGLSRQEYWSGLPFSSFRGSSQPRDQTCTSCGFCVGRQILYHLGSPLMVSVPY